MTTHPSIRCAIYTRKSSDEGLEQSFNSLHAQREACEAYVRSQISEGWVLSPVVYDDGGYSGGGMDRPALRRLLADVTAGQVDVVVVYKVDRLTRSLPDFARIIDVLDKRKVSFVSVTQQFNTVSSMGRLTLNVLLSFAQFEREVTGERIRDKIAASKAKGMWMGGNLPLGYDAPSDPTTRVLVVNEEEARVVRLIFQRFLTLGNSYALQQWLEEEGIRPKRWVSTRGRLVGGYAFSRGALLPLLKNRIYLGEITHKGKSYPGLHKAIVDAQTFEAAQALLASNSRKRRDHVGRAERVLLNGLVFDADGQEMQPVFGAKKDRRYVYYAAAPLIGRASDTAIRRVPAPALETIVLAIAEKVGVEGSAAAVRRLIGRVEIHSSTVQLTLRAKAFPGAPTQRAALAALRCLLDPGENALSDPSHAGLIRLVLPIRLVTRGGRTWQISADGRQLPRAGHADPKMVKALRAGHAQLSQCGIDVGSIDPSVWRRARAPQSAKARQTCRLALLAPDIQRAVLCGKTAKPLDHPDWQSIPLSWSAQRSKFLGPTSAVALARTVAEYPS